MSAFGLRMDQRLDPALSRACLLAVALVAAYAAVLLIAPFGPDGGIVFTDISMILAGVTAGSICRAAAIRSAGGQRRALFLLGASSFCFALGFTTISYYDLMLHVERPFPTLADVAFVPATMCSIAAMLSFPTLSDGASGRVRIFLDGLVISVAVLFVGWAFVLSEASTKEPVGGALGQVLSMAYTAGDIVAATTALIVIGRVRRGGGVPVGTVAAVCIGVLVTAIGDFQFAYAVVVQGSSTDRLFTVGWFASYVLFALGGYWSLRVAVPPERALPSRLGVLLPYMACSVALAAGVYKILHPSGLDPVLIGAGISLVALVMVRQFVLLRENLALTRELELRVHERTAELRKREERFRALVQNSTDVVMIVGIDGNVSWISPSVTGVYGFSPRELIGRPVTSTANPEDIDKVQAAMTQVRSTSSVSVTTEWAVRHKDGRWCLSESKVTNLLGDPSVEGLVFNTRDISERRALEQELEHQSFHDELTGLANRALFKNRVEHALARSQRRLGDFAVLICDIDGFKSLNDSLGHAIGDDVLKGVGRRLRRCVRPGDTVARLGGDEFALLLEDVNTETAADEAVARIREELHWPLEIGGREIYLDVSVGIATAVTAVASVDDLLAKADLAMFMAKSRGKGKHAVFEPTMHEEMVYKLEMEEDLRRAMERDQLAVHYQPIIDLMTGRIVAIEALVRWVHPKRGLVLPLEFIPRAEDCGLIVPLGRWVLSQACHQLREWQLLYPAKPPITMAVNISGRQLKDPTLLDDVRSVLTATGIDPRDLTLELTESVLVDNDDQVLSQMRRIRDMGVKLAIDDFGTGYSSYSYLRQFPIDRLKIDRSFVQGIGTELQDSALAHAITTLGKVLKLETVAEGIEHVDELSELVRIGCSAGQGFLFSHPVDPIEMTELLASGHISHPLRAATPTT